METIAKITTVGNSAAVLVPKHELKALHLRAGKKVRMILLPEKTLGELLQEEKTFKKSADQLSKELAQELQWD